MSHNIHIPYSALQDDLWLDGNLARVYLYLLSVIDTSGVAKVSQRDIASHTGLTPREVRLGLDRLEATCRITRQSRQITIIDAGMAGEPPGHCAAQAKVRQQDNFEWFREYFNAAVSCTTIPQITKLTDSRKNALRSIFKEYDRETVEIVIKKTIDSKFLSRDWGKAGFDWIFKKSNFIKILEGNYDNRTRQTTAADKYATRRGTDVGNHTSSDYGGSF